VPVLAAAGTALEAVAAGHRGRDQHAGTGVVRLGTAVETSLPAFAALGVGLKAAGGWMEAFNPTLTGVAGTILGKLMPALRMVGRRCWCWTHQAGGAGLGARQREARGVSSTSSNKAAASGVSTEFYQRIAKARRPRARRSMR
jgi:hypothetical protein